MRKREKERERERREKRERERAKREKRERKEREEREKRKKRERKERKERERERAPKTPNPHARLFPQPSVAFKTNEICILPGLGGLWLENGEECLNRRKHYAILQGL